MFLVSVVPFFLLFRLVRALALRRWLHRIGASWLSAYTGKVFESLTIIAGVSEMLHWSWSRCSYQRFGKVVNLLLLNMLLLIWPNHTLLWSLLLVGRPRGCWIHYSWTFGCTIRRT